jgi:hypothetical protein
MKWNILYFKFLGSRRKDSFTFPILYLWFLTTDPFYIINLLSCLIDKLLWGSTNKNKAITFSPFSPVYSSAKSCLVLQIFRLKNELTTIAIPCYVGLCHNGMACLLAAD